MSSLWPFFVLAIGIAFIVFAIAICRIHAFISLILAAVLVGILAETLPGIETQNHVLVSIATTMTELGSTAGKIAWVIALAAIIGLCLMESGAADKIVRVFVKAFGEKRAGWALMFCAFFLSIPVFFDTVFFLLIPLAQALAFRLGKKYLYFVMAVACGGVITHGLVPPTPGPLIMIDNLGLDLGLAMIIGIILGIPVAIAGLFIGQYLDNKNPIPVRESSSVRFADLKQIISKEDHELPSFIMAFLPILLPVVLIAAFSFLDTFVGAERLGDIHATLQVLGNKNVAMFLGTLIAIYVYVVQKNLNLADLAKEMEAPIQTAGVIILITAAGGAFGAMIKHAGVGDAIKEMTAGGGISLIFLAWIVSGILKLAQGSGTVAMITTSSIMAGIISDGTALDYSPLYIFAAIAFGSTLLSWMNDSGFWVVCKMSGMTEKETLQSWTVMLTLLSIIGLIEVFILSTIVPHPFG